jgi:hypothetical protein
LRQDRVFDGVTLAIQGVNQGRGDVRFVFDDENALGIRHGRKLLF